MNEPLPASAISPSPILNWAEREAGLDGQLPLPGLEDAPSLAERAFIRLAQRWHEGFSAVDRDGPPPRAVDELALAALLLAREHGAVFTEVAWQHARSNIEIAEMRKVPWMDRLSWRLVTAARLMEPGRSWEFDELRCNLNHHNSALRIWTMELAWMVRPWLDYESALPLLLGNVAGTLSGVEMSWGLAGTLFPSAEDFHSVAEFWQPEEFAAQYADRIVILKERGLLAMQAGFWKTEALCRRRIADEMTSLR
jgi:hypothetical protein